MRRGSSWYLTESASVRLCGENAVLFLRRKGNLVSVRTQFGFFGKIPVMFLRGTGRVVARNIFIRHQ